MGRTPIRCAVALDGGTTNTRARLWLDGRIAATARRAVGVRDTVLAQGRSALADAVRAALDEVLLAAEGVRPEVIVAAGMLSAEVGLLAVPHAVAPAGRAELARASVEAHLPEVADQPVLFVPGVRTPPAAGPDGWTAADVMRGEECETIGAWDVLAPSTGAAHTAFLWPGSHTKLVEVGADRRILRSHTSLAGELTSALARHTLLAASLPESLPDELDRDAAEAGARMAVRDGLGRAAFLVRIAALAGELDARARASFLVGAVIADDVASLVRHPILEPPVRVWVGGRQPQRSLYAEHLRRRIGASVHELDDGLAERASAMGALAIARERGERGGPATG